MVEISSYSQRTFTARHRVILQGFGSGPRVDSILADSADGILAGPWKAKQDCKY